MKIDLVTSKNVKFVLTIATILFISSSFEVSYARRIGESTINTNAQQEETIKATATENGKKSSSHHNSRHPRQHRKLVLVTENEEDIAAGRKRGVADQYIIRFNNNVDNVHEKARNLLERAGVVDDSSDAPEAAILHTYDSVFSGFAVSGLTGRLLEHVLDHEDVELVEQDQIGYGGAIQSRPPSWGLDRMDESLDDQYQYVYTGKGVKIFILDSGVRPTHDDFGGRVTCGFNAHDATELCEDTTGHGTHVAGTAGGSIYGVAKDASIVNVRILDSNNSGRYAQWISGLNWVKSQKEANPNIPMVVNMSVWGAKSRSLNAAVNALIDAGVVVVTIAGNNHGQDSCQYSPASTDAAIVVGATDIDDKRGSYSNTGSCIDIFAPGSGIKSGYHTHDDASTLMSGTSMASPHVAGVAALYLQANPNWTPAQVWDAMMLAATPNGIGNVGNGSPNLMITTDGIQQTCVGALKLCDAQTPCCTGTCGVIGRCSW